MSKLILTINAGGSSLKFQLIRMSGEELVTRGLVERIGLKDSIFIIEVGGEEVKTVQDIKNHVRAVNTVLDAFKKHNIINDINDIDGVGHRIVYSDEKFPEPVVITGEVEKEIEELNGLALLHNPADLMGIRAFRKLLPNIPHVTTFGTAFHQTVPEKVHLYNSPYHYYKGYGIRKYGFHGTSHKFVLQRAAEMLDKSIEDLRIIPCRIDNDVSIAATDDSRSINTSMSFIPLVGITMGTRSGDIDPASIPFIMEKTGKTAEQVLEILDKESGLSELSGISSDSRDLSEEAESSKARSQVALDVFTSEIHRYTESYVTRMHGVDAIASTAGIGENSMEVHAKVLEGLEFMGVYWDPKKNENLQRGRERFINYPHSPARAVVVPTDEESVITRDVMTYGGLKQFFNKY